MLYRLSELIAKVLSSQSTLLHNLQCWKDLGLILRLLMWIHNQFYKSSKKKKDSLVEK